MKPPAVVRTIWWCPSCWRRRLLGEINPETFRATMLEADHVVKTWRCKLCRGKVRGPFTLSSRSGRLETVPPALGDEDRTRAQLSFLSTNDRGGDDGFDRAG